MKNILQTLNRLLVVGLLCSGLMVGMANCGAQGSDSSEELEGTDAVSSELDEADGGGGAGGASGTCTDGIKNGTETSIDCGGTCPGKCLIGKTCLINGDCYAGNCYLGICMPIGWKCTDGIKNGTETAIDCGGTNCGACANGKACIVNSDCTSGSCAAGVCSAPTCADALKNGTETDVDCGGATCPDCVNGKTCLVAGDCVSGNCAAGVCAAPAPTCSDAIKNGSETDVDCGGLSCPDCVNGKTCLVAGDCVSGNCAGGVCAAPAPTCSDAIKNGSETDVDCGGLSCPDCVNGKTCLVAGDCVSGNCAGGVCAAPAPTCSDAIKNGSETDVDCGGLSCPDCVNGKTCLVAGDCVSGNCAGGVCAAPAPTCSDAIKNGSETDVDCGGLTCPDCVNGKTCLVAGDCVSGNCAGGVCSAPAGSCDDGIKNGTETSIDCGGTCPGKCLIGKTCLINGDCYAGNCYLGICMPIGWKCADGIKNGTETAIDCGGTNCGACADGKTCIVNSDCTSGSCNGGVCGGVAPTCSDAIKNGSETDVDCGGLTCPDCVNGKTCLVAGDCASGNCAGGVCAAPAPTCSDALKNGSETDVDCGGPTCPDCVNGKTCLVAGDCVSGNCAGGICAAPAPTCSDALKNGSETDVDCGGATCPDCVNGKTCLVAGDCVSGNCAGGICTAPAPTCSDALKNGTETDVDCGGATCPDCVNGKTCLVAGDCVSGNCAGGVCAAPAPTCSDAIKNGSETDVDCGGLSCPDCVNGKTCLVAGDCVSGNCAGGVCAAPAPTCSDAIKNGSKTDVDCGGLTCPDCVNGKTCLVAGDCVSGNCAGGVCAAPAPTCSDAIKNGSETDVDCGGLTCPDCVNGKTCLVAGDCVSGNCAGGVCSAPAGSCGDGIKNGTETSIDCGGTCPGKCLIGKTCLINGDCYAGNCYLGICMPIGWKCADGIKNGTETAIDCGGTNCGACADGKTCIVNADCTSGSCNGGVCGGVAPTCSDAIKNGSETDVDCGGLTCPDCVNGKTCLVAGDCASGNCAGGICAAPAPTCSDALKNGTETDVDCGGSSCPDCANGKTCINNGDCLSINCVGGVCTAPTCLDGLKNGSETDVDCGGAICATCANGNACLLNSDCASGNCAAGVCAAPAPTCIDGLKNGSETDVDCGGLTCPDCANGKTCLVAGDCVSGNCAGGVCAAPAPTCIDGLKNGSESDVDCGGAVCPDCANGKLCLANGDCLSNNCVGGVCAAPAPTCSDAIKNGTETDVDCGGPTCSDCVNGKTCLVAGDCVSGNCAGGICAAPAPTCSDALKNGSETDVDCGGGTCPACSNGQTCAVGADCSSGNCAGGICAAPAPTCSDALKNGTETDVDCGGPTCPDCVNGKTCLVAGDCASGNCAGGICAAPAPTCSDALKNGTETDVDCGGSSCPDCANGKTCINNGDCLSINCVGGVCTAPTCLDGLKNGSETDVDCGGAICATCANGNACLLNSDCASGNCAAGVCAAPAPTCSDAIKNGSETDVDCGGLTCPDCANGKTCLVAGDCVSGNCAGGVCAAPAPTCIDGLKNGSESDVDCGGAVCPDCANGKLCLANGDCLSNNCVGGVCTAVAVGCMDGLKNGAETDVDCGGGTCPLCANGKTCSSLVDCASASCASGICAAIVATCTDGIKNGAETDIDCGGGTCTKCANGKVCLGNTDCASAGCVGNVCSVVAATCSDGLKNGAESDVDCGGASCPKCAIGLNCNSATDCTIVNGFAQCQNGFCIVPNSLCNDKAKNGSETDIDCGGAACGKCQNGWICSVGSDCRSGACSGAICVAANPTCFDGIKNSGETDTDCGGPVCAKCAGGQTCSNHGDCLGNSCVANACAGGAFSALWSARYGNATDQECDVVKTDAAENVFIANYITGLVNYGLGNVGNGEYISLVKLNPTGTTLWSKAYPDGTKQYPNGLAVNPAGNLFLSGSFYNTLKFGTPAAAITSLGVDDLYAAGFSNVGATSWAKRFGDSAQFQQFNRIAVDAQGNPIMTGWLSGNANFGGGNLNGNNVDIIVVKLNTAGTHVWSKKYGNGDLQGGHAVAVDASGNVIVVGYSNGSVDFGGGAIGGGTNIFLLKLNSNGNYLWAKTFTSTQTELKAHRIAVDAAGNIFIGGGKRGTINFGGGALATVAGTGIYDAYLAKFDASGNHVWSKNVGDGQDQWVNDLAVDAAGNVIATGSFLGTVNFGGGAMTSLGGTEFGGDVFLTKLSSAGTQLFAARYGDASQQEPKSLTLDASGNVLLCGAFKGSINFGTGSLASAGGNDIFVTKLRLP